MSKRKKVVQLSDCSDDDEEIVPSQSQSKRSQTTSREDIEVLANNLVHYLIVADQKKLPIKRTSINKIVMKENSRAFSDVFEVARRKLRQNFGIDVREVADKRGMYMLLNELKSNRENPYLKWSPDELHKSGLLLVILSHIFMNDSIVTEDHLWSNLKRLGINPDAHHEVFGDVKKLVNQEFKQQLYLEVTKIEGTDPPQSQYLWGPRAIAEVSKEDVLKFVCLIYGDMRPEDWVQQCREAQESSAARSNQNK